MCFILNFKLSVLAFNFKDPYRTGRGEVRSSRSVCSNNPCASGTLLVARPRAQRPVDIQRPLVGFHQILRAVVVLPGVFFLNVAVGFEQVPLRGRAGKTSRSPPRSAPIFCRARCWPGAGNAARAPPNCKRACRPCRPSRGRAPPRCTPPPGARTIASSIRKKARVSLNPRKKTDLLHRLVKGALLIDLALARLVLESQQNQGMAGLGGAPFPASASGCPRPFRPSPISCRRRRARRPRP